MRLSSSIISLSWKIHLPAEVDATSCTVKSRRVARELEFIELSGCPTGIPITVRSISPLRRMLA